MIDLISDLLAAGIIDRSRRLSADHCPVPCIDLPGNSPLHGRVHLGAVPAACQAGNNSEFERQRHKDNSGIDIAIIIIQRNLALSTSIPLSHLSCETLSPDGVAHPG
jgi:hypothetical protein